jgi:hypothetical protein
MDPKLGEGAGQMVARNAEIRLNILLYLDSRSLVVCLRTSKLLFHLAGPRIYRRLDIGSVTLEKTLEGWTFIGPMGIRQACSTRALQGTHGGIP